MLFTPLRSRFAAFPVRWRFFGPRQRVRGARMRTQLHSLFYRSSVQDIVEDGCACVDGWLSLKMTTKWDNELELTLLECYQAEPMLWQSKHKDHKNKNKVHDAWTRISAILNIPVAELKKKKDSLMSSYKTYRKKVKDSMHSGAGSSDIYKPIWFAYQTMDSFLGDGVKCNKTINTEESSSVINDEEESLDATVNDRQSTTATEDDGQSMRPPTVCRRNKPVELEAAGETVKEALVTLKETMKSRRIQEDDECDLHGKVIAKKLRKIPENERMQLVCEIYNLFMRHEQRTLASFSQYVSSPSPSPPYNRMQKHFSQTRGYSEPITSHYQRAHSSHSNYSDPPMHYYMSPPEIHIPEETPAPAASQIIITSNKSIRPATQEVQEPTDNVSSIIDFAFRNA